MSVRKRPVDRTESYVLLTEALDLDVTDEFHTHD